MGSELTFEKDGCGILYQDRQLLVCAKRSGLPVQSARLGVKDLEGILKTYLREEDAGGRLPFLAAVNRLDQPVQGLVLFARTKEAAAQLGRQLADGRMEKRYLARVHLTEKAAAELFMGSKAGLTKRTLEDYLIREGKNNTSRVVPAKTAGAKRALLSFDCVRRYDGEKDPQALLRIHLMTGRHHQIRVQLSHAGLPIVGDQKYGVFKEEDPGFPALCAYELSFFDLRGGRRREFRFPEEYAASSVRDGFAF